VSDDVADQVARKLCHGALLRVPSARDPGEGEDEPQSLTRGLSPKLPSEKASKHLDHLLADLDLGRWLFHLCEQNHVSQDQGLPRCGAPTVSPSSKNIDFTVPESPRSLEGELAPGRLRSTA